MERLSESERNELWDLYGAGESQGSIGRRLGRSPSTVSREVKFNGGHVRYRATLAYRASRRRAKRPKTMKLQECRRLGKAIEGKLELWWSPSQISRRRVRAYPDDEEMRVANSCRVARVSNEAERLEALRLPVDEVRLLTVGVLNVKPGDFDDATGGDLWAQALSLLRGDAEGALDGSYRDLSTWSVEWLSKMTDRCDVRVYLEAGDGAEFTLRATGDEALMLGETGGYLRQAEIKGRSGNASRRLRG